MTRTPDQRPPEPARIRPRTEAELPPDVADAIAAYRQVFNVKSVRVVGPDEERGIPDKRWRMDEVAHQSEEYLNHPPLPIELIPVPKNAKPPEACMGAQASLRPDGALEQLSMDLQPQGADHDDEEPDCPARHDHERGIRRPNGPGD